jgi:8-oxo-dGTP pyrophosphatase MutT (NUDIX family)
MAKIIIASGPVIVEDGKVLLNISSGDKFWKFCGGKIKEGDRLAQTAVRRAKEELGINIDILNDKPFFTHTAKVVDGEESDIVLVHWLATRQGEIVAGDMVEKWQWLDLNRLPENLGLNIVPALRHFGFLKN